MKPVLIVSVDTEEEGLWSGRFDRAGGGCRNLRGLERFQALCARLGIAPTYLVDTPVANDPWGVEFLADVQARGAAEIGAHLHPWCAEPFEEPLLPRNTWLCNLPKALQFEKLRRLTDLIRERFGRSPRSFRAGRYGLDAWGALCLRRLGYAVDSSVLPYFDYSGQGGPDFGTASPRPYYVDDGNLLAQSDPHRAWHRAAAGEEFLAPLLEVPVSTGFPHPRFETAARLRRWAERSPLRRFKLVGLLDRLGVARRIKFTPEQHSAAELKRLAALYVKQEMPCLTMLLHSSSLAVGHSPYAADERGLERLYRTLEETLTYCRDELRLSTLTLGDFASRHYAFRVRPEFRSPEWSI